MRRILLAAATFVAALAAGCSTAPSSQPPPASTPAAAPSGEEAWIRNADRWLLNVSSTLETLYDVSAQESIIFSPRRTDTEMRDTALRTLRVELDRIGGCGSSLQTDVGEPPAGWLLSVYRPLRDACRNLEEGFLLLREYWGVDSQDRFHQPDVSLRQDAEASLVSAEASLQAAEKELARISS